MRGVKRLEENGTRMSSKKGQLRDEEKNKKKEKKNWLPAPKKSAQGTFSSNGGTSLFLFLAVWLSVRLLFLYSMVEAALLSCRQL